MFSRILPINYKKRILLTKITAFTLIEVLIVIFVLGVGILGISIVITKNLSVAKNLHIRNNATLLAREGIELVYNVRDTNNLLWYERNCAQRSTVKELSDLQNTENNENNSICKSYFWTGDELLHRFTIEGINKQQVILSWISGTSFDDLYNNSKLYLTGWWDTPIYYTHIWWGSTPLARYITFTGVSDIPNNSLLSLHDIHHIFSTVLYKIDDTTTGSVELESLIANKD